MILFLGPQQIFLFHDLNEHFLLGHRRFFFPEDLIHLIYRINLSIRKLWYKEKGSLISQRSSRARDGIRTRDPRLGKAILHHWATRALLNFVAESTRRDSNPRPSPWQGDTPPLSHSCIVLFCCLRARDGIRTRDPRLGKAILHHWATRAFCVLFIGTHINILYVVIFVNNIFYFFDKYFIAIIYRLYFHSTPSLLWILYTYGILNQWTLSNKLLENSITDWKWNNQLIIVSLSKCDMI